MPSELDTSTPNSSGRDQSPSAAEPNNSKFANFLKNSGPGWLQSAVTLGGGSLAGALYLGIIGGTHLLWLQPTAMALGVIMLAAITYFTLSSEDRPFRAVQKHVSPTLAWAWLIGTVVADIVFCVAQFALGVDTIQNNLGFSNVPAFAITGILFVLGVSILWFYAKDSDSAKPFDNLLKVLVALVVLCFFSVVGVLAWNGEISIIAAIKGLVPNLKSLFQPPPELSAIIESGDAHTAVWREILLAGQRDKIIGAFGAAVGINMTFLLPYSLMKRRWKKSDRSWARIDLCFGLFIPFTIASSCLVLAAAAAFYASTAAVLDQNGEPLPEMRAAYHGVMNDFLIQTELRNENESIEAQIAALSATDREIGAMLTNRGAKEVAQSLVPLMGKTLSQGVFGIGVLAMAVSTLLIHMIMNGYAVSEAVGSPGKRVPFFLGSLMPAFAGLFTPLLWMGKPTVKLALLIPASVIATTLLPIAYITFLLLMNSKRALGDERPSGASRIIWNVLLSLSTFAAGFASIWALSNKGTAGVIGICLLAALAAIGIVGFFKRQRAEAMPPAR